MNNKLNCKNPIGIFEVTKQVYEKTRKKIEV